MKPTNYKLVEDKEGQFMGDVALICDAPLQHQEDVSCWRMKHHRGPHESIAAWPPCPSCGGLDMHDDDCPQSDLTTNGAVIVQWRGARGPRCGARQYQHLDNPACLLHKGHVGPHRDGSRAFRDWRDKPEPVGVSSNVTMTEGEERTSG